MEKHGHVFLYTEYNHVRIILLPTMFNSKNSKEWTFAYKNHFSTMNIGNP